MHIILCALLALTCSNVILSSEVQAIKRHRPEQTLQPTTTLKPAKILKPNEQLDFNQKLLKELDDYSKTEDQELKQELKYSILIHKLIDNPDFNPNTKIKGITLAQLIFRFNDLDLTSAVLRYPALNLEEKDLLGNSLLHIIWDRLVTVPLKLKIAVYKAWLMKNPDKNIKEVLNDTSCSDACKKKGYECLLDIEMDQVKQLLKIKKQNAEFTNYLQKRMAILKNKKHSLEELQSENFKEDLEELQSENLEQDLEELKSENFKENLAKLIENNKTERIQNRNIDVIKAAATGSNEALKALYLAGADMNARDQYDELGHTPAHLAAKNGFDSTIKILHQAGVNMNIKDRFGYTPTHTAAIYGHDSTIKTLHEAGANMNIKNAGGNTPAHFAAENNSDRTFKTLRSLGADMNIKNNAGYTPVETQALAKQRNNLRSSPYTPWDYVGI